MKSKSKGTAIALALFLGSFGIHKFYLEKSGQGVMYAIFFWTFIPAILSIIDIIKMLMMNDQQWAEYVNPPQK